MAAVSRDRKRRSAAIRRRRRRVGVVRDERSEALPIRAFYRPSDVSSCIDGFETRSSPEASARLNKSRAAISRKNIN